VGVPAFGCWLDAMPRESQRRPSEKKFEKPEKKVDLVKKNSWSLQKNFFANFFLFQNAE
jgi:hypothetical protein